MPEAECTCYDFSHVLHASLLTLMLLQVAVVTLTFPATPLLLARARICISASHTKEDLVKALKVKSNI